MMRKISKRLLISLAFVICQLSLSVAQTAGDIISGTVTDEYGPVIGANVVELDAANRIVASAVTDLSGNFSFKLKNPKDKLRITYVGAKTVTLPFRSIAFTCRAPRRLRP